MYRSRLLAGAAACALLCAASAAGAAETPYFRFKSLAPDAAAGGSTGGGSTDNGGTGTGGTGGTGPDTTPTTLPAAQRLKLNVRYQSNQPPQVGTNGVAGFVSTDEGRAPFTYTATGLPAGLSVSCGDSYCENGNVAGTPAAAGFYPVTVTVTDALGNAGDTSFQMPVGKPDGQGGSAFLNDLTLSVTQPYYGPGASYLPGPAYDNTVTWSLSPNSAPLPPGLALSSGPFYSNNTNLFDYNSSTPTQVGTYPGIILRATPQSGPAVDSAPATITVKALALSASATPQLVRVLPGNDFGARQTFKGLVTYGQWTSQDNFYDFRNVAHSWELVPENGSKVPDGLSWDNDNLTFTGTATTPGQTGTFHIAATVAGSNAVSPSFTVEVKRELNVVLNQPECRYNPGSPAMGSFPAVPAGLQCEDTFYSSGDPVPVPGGMPVTTKVVVYGGDNPTCTLSAGSTLPAGMTLNPDCTFSGTTPDSADGMTPSSVSLDVTANGITGKVGPFQLYVQPGNSFMPRLVAVTIPYVQMNRDFCENIFRDMSHYPYSNVSATNMPSYMTLSPDGNACPTRAMNDAEYRALPQNVPGKLKATDGAGKTYEVDVRFGAGQEPH